MNTFSSKILNDAKINELSQQLLDSYVRELDQSSAGGWTELGKNATYSLVIEGDNLEKLVLYFNLNDYYRFVEFGVNGIGYNGDEKYKQEVVNNALFSFRDNGRWLPVGPLENWIKRKNVRIPTSSSGKVPSVKQYAYMLSRTIKKHGLKPRHLLDDNLTQNDHLLEGIKLRILEIFQETVNEELNKINE